MEEIRRADQRRFGRTGLILLFAEKRPGRGADECNQTGILTSASNLTPAFPSFRLVALGVCSRYSGATVPEFHRVPRHLTAMVGGNFFPPFKERHSSTPDKKFSKPNVSRARGKRVHPGTVLVWSSAFRRFGGNVAFCRLKAELRTGRPAAIRTGTLGEDAAPAALETEQAQLDPAAGAPACSRLWAWRQTGRGYEFSPS